MHNKWMVLILVMTGFVGLSHPSDRSSSLDLDNAIVLVELPSTPPEITPSQIDMLNLSNSGKQLALVAARLTSWQNGQQPELLVFKKSPELKAAGLVESVQPGSEDSVLDELQERLKSQTLSTCRMHGAIEKKPRRNSVAYNTHLGQ